MPDDYGPAPVKRIAQIISHRNPNTNDPASSSILAAKRIHEELLVPVQGELALTRQRLVEMGSALNAALRIIKRLNGSA